MMRMRSGAAGVPLYLWYHADGKVEVLPQVLTMEMLLTRAQLAPRYLVEPVPPEIQPVEPARPN